MRWGGGAGGAVHAPRNAFERIDRQLQLCSAGEGLARSWCGPQLGGVAGSDLAGGGGGTSGASRLWPLRR